MLRSFCVVMLSIFALSCSKNVSEKSILESVAGDQSAGDEVDYVASFDSEEEANEHAREVEANGATVERLSAEGNLLRVSGAMEAFDGVNVHHDTLLSRNANISISRPSRHRLSVEMPNDPTTFFTNRTELGVDKLLARVPEANGQGIKIAVFDTGIEFGVQGIEKAADGSQKLVGFYDMSGFGHASPQSYQSTAIVDSYDVGGKPLKFAAEIEAQRVESRGVLSEASLAKYYFTRLEELDINSNGNEKGDEFLYLVGVNKEGKQAVWIDVDQDGAITDRDREELTDYNSTYKFIELPFKTGSGADAESIDLEPLAVTINSANELQFHNVGGNHGTAVALVIGGDGYANGQINGLAPKVQFVSYMLDFIGQDVYTMAQFMEMFTHARDQGVQGINISWGHATADLESARNFGAFLEKEILEKGVMIASSAGNDGPGFSSAIYGDNIGRHSFSIGAAISERQSGPVYGMSGDVPDSMIWYSSFGPTRGGRQSPDISAPIMTWVRDIGPNPNPWRGFGGTSSAAPNLMGAVSAMASGLKNRGHQDLDTRLMKMAVLSSARKLDTAPQIRQGAGIVDADAAFDKYLELAMRAVGVRNGLIPFETFPYEIVAEATVEGINHPGEGVVLFEANGSTLVRLKFMGETAELAEPRVTSGIVRLETDSDFFEVPQMTSVQVGGGRFAVKFNTDRMTEAKTYADTIRVLSMSGDLLLMIPVVVHNSVVRPENGLIASARESLKLTDVYRKPFHLSEATELQLEGFIFDQDGTGVLGPYGRERIYIGIQSLENGFQNFFHYDIYTKPFTTLDLTTEILPAGNYELFVGRAFGRPSALSDEVEVSLNLRTPYGSVKSASRYRAAPAPETPAAPADSANADAEDSAEDAAADAGDADTEEAPAEPDPAVVRLQNLAGNFDVLIESRIMANVTKAEIEIVGELKQATLVKDLTRERKGFYGTVELPADVKEIDFGLSQSSTNYDIANILHMELTILDTDSQNSLFRGWINDFRPDSPIVDHVKEDSGLKKLDLMAYPNIVDWDVLRDNEIYFDYQVPFEKPIALKATPGSGSASLGAGQGTLIQFDVMKDQEADLLGKKVVGKIKLDGLASLPIVLQF